MDINELHKHFISSKGISTDTREKLNGKLFFALKGENFNGNRFAKKALAAGAKVAVVDEANSFQHEKLILVDDVLKTLQQLATFHRNYLDLPILAITGSNGKTTTKELVAAVLSKKYKVAFTHGNFNNHIGVPLTLLKMDQSTQIGIVEMGANHQKEIERLCQIAQPDYGYITNFGKAHLEGFGGIEGVIKGKSELYDFLIENDKTIFVNADDRLQGKQSEGGKRITFSQSKNADCQIQFQSASPFAKVQFDGLLISSKLLGNYNAKNIAAAICVGNYFEVPSTEIKTAIQNYTSENNRSQILKQGSNEIILDAYNANPTSMQLALENFKNYTAEKKVAILGDMFEVGKTASDEHQHIVDFLEKMELDKAFVCGEHFAETKVKNIRKFETFEDLQAAISNENLENATILIKGSRGMALERLLKILGFSLKQRC